MKINFNNWIIDYTVEKLIMYKYHRTLFIYLNKLGILNEFIYNIDVKYSKIFNYNNRYDYLKNIKDDYLLITNSFNWKKSNIYDEMILISKKIFKE
jgi:hypothetical protein